AETKPRDDVGARCLETRLAGFPVAVAGRAATRGVANVEDGHLGPVQDALTLVIHIPQLDARAVRTQRQAGRGGPHNNHVPNRCPTVEDFEPDLTGCACLTALVADRRPAVVSG